MENGRFLLTLLLALSFNKVLHSFNIKALDVYPTCPANTFDCTEKYDGDYADPLSGCSTTYYTCTNHICYQRSCEPPNYSGPQLVFLPSVDSCGYTFQDPACGTKVKKLGNGRPKLDASASTVTPCNFDCSGKADGDYGDPTNDCTSHYYICANGYCYNMYCSSNPYLVYDPSNDECVYPQDLPACSGISTQKHSTISPGTATSGTGPTPPACSYDCSNKANGDYADPASNCTGHYYVCDEGVCFNYNCYPPLIYNPANDQCDYKQDVPGCQ